jgi:hypothetical protein
MEKEGGGENFFVPNTYLGTSTGIVCRRFIFLLPLLSIYSG